MPVNLLISIHVDTCMDKEEKMCVNIMKLIEQNAHLREQNAVLSCALLFMTGWFIKVKIKAHKEKKNKEGE